jgi:hypothetical protein
MLLAMAHTAIITYRLAAATLLPSSCQSLMSSGKLLLLEATIPTLAGISNYDEFTAN